MPPRLRTSGPIAERLRGAEELVALRTRDTKHFRNADGTGTAVIGHNQHYEAAPGRWEDVDLSFRSDGVDQVVERSSVVVRSRQAGVEVVDRSNGKGILWLTPSPPVVAEGRARVADRGLSWEYTPTEGGVKLTATVSARRGPQTYSFPYELLGGAAPLGVDLSGNLTSDAFVVPRAVAIGADLVSYPAGAWRIGRDRQVSFNFDDSGLPAAAVPYVIDPGTWFYIAAGADDGNVLAQASTYPPGGPYVNTDNAQTITERSYYPGNNLHFVSSSLMRWNTAGSVPPGGILLNAAVALPVCLRESLDSPGRSLTTDWYSNWPIDPSDYAPTAQTGALSVPISSLTSVASGLEYSCIVGSTAPSYNYLWLTNHQNVNTSGYTGLRFHVSGGQPTSRNRVHLKALEVGGGAAYIFVGYSFPVPPPSGPIPASGEVADRLTPVLQVANQGAGIQYQFRIRLKHQPTVFAAGGTVDVPSEWLTTPYWRVGPGVLRDNADYEWYVVARNADLVESPPSAVWTIGIDAQQLGASPRYAMHDVALGHGVTASVNVGNGNLVVSQTDVSLPTVSDPFVVSRTYDARGAGKPVYVEDATPYGATLAGTWQWDTVTKFSGSQSHFEPRPPGAATHHQHYFIAPGGQFVPAGATIVTYAYLDPASMPQQLMLQALTGDPDDPNEPTSPLTAQWRRGYWGVQGQDLIPYGVGSEGTPQRQWMGALPAGGTWVRLEMPAKALDLEERTLFGFAYTLYDGQAWFDKTYVDSGREGAGWSTSYDVTKPADRTYRRLLFPTGTAAKIELVPRSGEGRVFSCENLDGQLYQYDCRSLAGERVFYEAVGGRYIVKTAEQTVYRFLPSGVPEFDEPEYLGQHVAAITPEYEDTGANEGRLEAVRDAIERRLTFEYTAPSGCAPTTKLSRVRAPFDGDRILAEYCYDAHGQLLSVTDAEGHTTTYTYDATTHDLQSVTTPEGHTTFFEYGAPVAGESQRRLSEIRRPLQDGSMDFHRTTFAYTATDPVAPATPVRSTSVTSPRGNATQTPGDFVTSYVFDLRNRPTRITDARNNSTVIVWDPDPHRHLRTAVTDRNGDTTTFAYDKDGNLCRVTLPAPAGATTYRYDDYLGPLHQCSTSFGRFPAGKNLRTAEIDGAGHETRYEYERIRLDDPATGEIEAPAPSGDAADTVPWVTAVVRAPGTADEARTTFTYYTGSAAPWLVGRLEEKTMPKGNAPGCTDPCPDAYTTTYRYWLAGDTYGGVSQQGFLKSTAQPGDNPVAACGGTEATVCLHYDARGNVVHFLDAKGDHYADYDLDNRVSRAQARGSVGAPDPDKWVDYTYDADGNRTRVDDRTVETDPDLGIATDQTQFAYNDLGQLQRAWDAWGTLTEYTYDENGNRTTKAVGGVVTSYAYNSIDLLASLTDQAATPQAQTTSYPDYDGEGRLLQKVLPNGTHVDYAYDGAGRLEAVHNRTATGTIADFAYTYYPDGRKQTEARPGGTVTYGYDGLGRLATATQGSTTRTYTYDKNSNRTKLEQTGSAPIDYEVDALDRLTSLTGPGGTETFVYDNGASQGAGEVTRRNRPGGVVWTYTYDERGRPTTESAGTSTTTSELDGLGRVLRKTVTGGASSTIEYTYDNPGDSPASQIDVTGPLPEESTFIADAGGLLATRTAAGSDYHYYSGHGDLAQTLVGATALPLHPQALTFDEFGNRQVTTAAPPAYGWTGQQQRATNVATTVVRMGVRLYDPTLGRFLSKDPVPGGSANNYDYCFGDPVNCFDLSGLFSTRALEIISVIAGVAAAIAGAVVVLAAAGPVTALATLASFGFGLASLVTGGVATLRECKAGATNSCVSGAIATGVGLLTLGVATGVSALARSATLAEFAIPAGAFGSALGAFGTVFGVSSLL